LPAWDVSRKQSVMEGYKLLTRTLMLATGSCASRSTRPAPFRVLGARRPAARRGQGDHIQLDPTKITVDISSCGMDVDELQQELFSRFNITIEKSTFTRSPCC